MLVKITTDILNTHCAEGKRYSGVLGEVIDVPDQLGQEMIHCKWGVKIGDSPPKPPKRRLYRINDHTTPQWAGLGGECHYVRPGDLFDLSHITDGTGPRGHLGKFVELDDLPGLVIANAPRLAQTASPASTAKKASTAIRGALDLFRGDK